MTRHVDPSGLIAHTLIAADLLDWLWEIERARKLGTPAAIPVRSGPLPKDVNHGHYRSWGRLRLPLGVLPMEGSDRDATLRRLASSTHQAGIRNEASPQRLHSDVDDASVRGGTRPRRPVERRAKTDSGRRAGCAVPALSRLDPGERRSLHYPRHGGRAKAVELSPSVVFVASPSTRCPLDLHRPTRMGTRLLSWTAAGSREPTPPASPTERIPTPHTWCMR